MQSRPESRPAQTDRVRSVSEVNAEARFLIEQRFRRVWIEGEISNFRPYASGHWYFSLQDDRSQLRCVMFSSANRFVRHGLHNGLSVVVRGRLSIYEGRGEFQAIIDHIEPAGERQASAARAPHSVTKSNCCCDPIPPPEGRSRWTLKLLADKVVELELVDSLSYETVRRTLKKTV